MTIRADTDGPMNSGVGRQHNLPSLVPGTNTTRRILPTTIKCCTLPVHLSSALHLRLKQLLHSFHLLGQCAKPFLYGIKTLVWTSHAFLGELVYVAHEVVRGAVVIFENTPLLIASFANENV